MNDFSLTTKDKKMYLHTLLFKHSATTRSERVAASRSTICWFLILVLLAQANAWIIPPLTTTTTTTNYHNRQSFSNILLYSHSNFDSLLDMDVVIYEDDKTKARKIGAMQEDGTIAPLSVWTMEAAYGNSLEFVVDEEHRFPGLSVSTIKIIQVLPEHVIGYGSRQVGGGKGPGNPHGEESELLYYVDRQVLDGIEFDVNPKLEILW